MVDALVAMGAQMSYRDAIRLGRFEATKRLFHYDPSLAIPTAALYDAIHVQSEELVRWLVSLGVELGGPSGDRFSQDPDASYLGNVVAWAIQRGAYDSAAILLESGAAFGDRIGLTGVLAFDSGTEDPVLTDMVRGLVDQVIEHNQLALLEQLLKRGFRPGGASNGHLVQAARLGHREVFAALVAAGAKPDEETLQLLESAALARAPEVDPGPPLGGGAGSPHPQRQWTPVTRPPKGPLPAVADVLKREGWAAVLIAFGSEESMVQAMVLSPNRVGDLIAAGHSIHGRDSSGQTPLHLACDLAWPESISLLLQAGADPNRRTDDGRLPLEILAREFVYPADLLVGTKALIDAGADPAKATLYGPFVADLLYSQLDDERSRAAMQELLAPHLPPWLWR